MRARVVTGQFRPDKLDQALAIYHEQLPTIRDQPGCEGLLLLTDRTTNKAVSVALWATDDALRAGETDFRSRLSRYADLMVGAPTVTACEVAVAEPIGGEAKAARVTRSRVHQGREDEAVRIVRDDILPAARQQPGFEGMLQLIDRTSGDGLACTLWASEAAMTTSEEQGFYREQMAKVTDLLAAAPVKETYTVSVREGRPMRHAFAVPIPPGQVEACRRLVAEWMVPEAPHRREYDDLQRRAGITHESYWLQTGPNGDQLIVVSDGDQRGFAELMAQDTSPAARQFREQIQAVFGIDPATMGAAPEPEQLVEWRLP